MLNLAFLLNMAEQELFSASIYENVNNFAKYFLLNIAEHKFSQLINTKMPFSYLIAEKSSCSTNRWHFRIY